MKSLLLVTAFCAGITAMSPAASPSVNLGKVPGAQVSGRSTVAEFYPYDRVIVTSSTAPVPVRYGLTRETVFVDERGRPVRVDRIQRGAPVTVQYVREHDRMMASRVVVQRAAEPATVSKAEAKALRAYYSKLARSTKDPRERADARAQREYYDKLEEQLRD